MLIEIESALDGQESKGPCSDRFFQAQRSKTSHPLCKRPAGTGASYGYQDNDDLTILTQAWSGGQLGYAYTRNGAHQMTGLSISNVNFLMKSPTPVSTYTPTALNTYSTVGGVALSYDGNGNLTNDGTRTYEYDEENRLRAVTGAGHSIGYAYDPLGRRRSKSVDAVLTYFISDGANELAEVDGSGTRQRLYVSGDGMDRHIAMYSDVWGGTWDFFHVNHQGSTVLMTRNGQIGTSFSYLYGPYGESADNLTGAPFRYTGRYLDAETGLYYYRARYYSPALGRFLQTDPIGAKDDLNLYAYTGGDPVNNADPMGTEGIDPPLILGGEAFKENDSPSSLKDGANQIQLSSGLTITLVVTNNLASKVAETADKGGQSASATGAVASVAAATGLKGAAAIAEVAGKVGNLATGVQAAAQVADGKPGDAVHTVTGAVIDKMIGQGAGAAAVAISKYPGAGEPAAAVVEAVSNRLHFGENISRAYEAAARAVSDASPPQLSMPTHEEMQRLFSGRPQPP